MIPVRKSVALSPLVLLVMAVAQPLGAQPAVTLATSPNPSAFGAPVTGA